MEKSRYLILDFVNIVLIRPPINPNIIAVRKYPTWKTPAVKATQRKSTAAPRHMPIIGPNSKPPILIRIDSTMILVPDHSLKTTDARFAVTTIKNITTAIDSAKIIPIFAIPLVLGLGIKNNFFFKKKR